ncbi:hypothetical protein [Tsuneonella mangrovi]|uniref:hypothetical protein n=1 Tax=Tsuneonella mangrovi TaxID=1982042 RepID=UPI000BA202CC|nr:hypothetical protein [Tsuneonella mangrovi]
MSTFFRFASAGALLASASLAATPALAAELPRAPQHHDLAAIGAFDAASINAHDYGRWGHRHHDRIDAGDVIGGLLAVGIVAAIATSIGNSSKNKDRPNNDYRYPDNRYPDDRTPEYRSQPDSQRYDSGNGLSQAIDTCTGTVNRDGVVDSVDSASRNGEGWVVEGRLRTGGTFTCTVGSDGRIDGVDYGNRGALNDRQWSNERYAEARRAQDNAPANADAMPAYPGGPVGDQSAQGDISG